MSTAKPLSSFPPKIITPQSASSRRADATPATTARTIYLIKRAQFASHLRLEDSLRPFRLTAAQYMVMSVLGHRGQLSSAQLSRRFSVKPQSMFKLITTLERKGLIARKEVDRDRRTLMVSLTPAGRRLLAACDEAVDALEADILKDFSPTQLKQFRIYLMKIAGDTQRRNGKTSVQ